MAGRISRSEARESILELLGIPRELFLEKSARSTTLKLEPSESIPNPTIQCSSNPNVVIQCSKSNEVNLKFYDKV